MQLRLSSSLKIQHFTEGLWSLQENWEQEHWDRRGSAVQRWKCGQSALVTLCGLELAHTSSVTLLHRISQGKRRHQI